MFYKADLFKGYIKSGEKRKEDFKVGFELEHFVVYKDTFKTVSYYGEGGVEQTLKELLCKGWEGTYYSNYLLSLNKEDLTITLEPGSQLEISIAPKKFIKELDEAYIRFIKDINPILKAKGQCLVALGYHPVTKIDEIKLLPKNRYNIMYEHFKGKGKLAHNMMKGTAALQVSIDYENEKDFSRKFRILNALSPVFYAMCENVFIFEGERAKIRNTRASIWLNTDDERQGTVEYALEDNFNYSKYADYILSRHPILTIQNGEVIETHEKRVDDIVDENTSFEEVDHLLTMVFPDVRAKRYLEIRMMDSLPYPLCISVIALIKGVFYNEQNLDELEQLTKRITLKDVLEAKRDMLEKGISAKLSKSTISSYSSLLLDMAKRGLDDDERQYLGPVEKLIQNQQTPYNKSSNGYIDNGLEGSVKWAIIEE